MARKAAVWTTFLPQGESLAAAHGGYLTDAQFYNEMRVHNTPKQSVSRVYNDLRQRGLLKSNVEARQHQRMTYNKPRVSINRQGHVVQTTRTFLNDRGEQVSESRMGTDYGALAKERLGQHAGGFLSNVTDSQWKILVLIEMLAVMGLAMSKNWGALLAKAGVTTTSKAAVWALIFTNPVLFAGFLTANIVINGKIILAGVALFAIAFLLVDAGAGLFAAGIGAIMAMAMVFGPPQWFTYTGAQGSVQAQHNGMVP